MPPSEAGRPPASTNNASEPEPSSDERLPLIELESLFSRPPSWSKRLLYSGLLLATVGALLFAAHGFIFPAPAPNDLLIPTVLVSNVTYGSVTVNGEKQAAPPPLRIFLRKNAPNEITLSALPFLSETCHITARSAVNNPEHCTLSTGPLGSMHVNNGSVNPLAIATIYLTTDDLPPEQEYQALSLIEQALTALQQIAVPAGSYLATGVSPVGDITSQIATIPLTASAMFSTDIISDPYARSQFCDASICPWELDPREGPIPTGRFWSIIFTTYLRWRFTDASGALVSNVEFPAPLSVQMLLSYQERTGWQVSSQGFSGTLADQLQHAVCPVGNTLLGMNLGGDSPSIHTTQDQGLAGCLVEAQAGAQGQGLFLWRFGVLLAADAGAQQLLPTLPVAPPAEMAAVGG